MTDKPPATVPAPNQAIENLEQELSVLWRRARAASQRVARAVHPDLEPAAYGLLVLLQRRGPLRLTDAAQMPARPTYAAQMSAEPMPAAATYAAATRMPPVHVPEPYARRMPAVEMRAVPDI